MTVHWLPLPGREGDFTAEEGDVRYLLHTCHGGGVLAMGIDPRIQRFSPVFDGPGKMDRAREWCERQAEFIRVD